MLEALRAQVLEGLDHPLSVTELAGRAGVSRTHYSHHFKAVTGMTPARAVVGVRVGEAARLLAGTDRKLSAVARATGFADAKHLSRAFRRPYGVPPAEFRRQGHHLIRAWLSEAGTDEGLKSPQIGFLRYSSRAS